MKRVLPSAGLSGPQHYWKMMAELSAKGGFTVSDVHKLTNGRSRATVKSYVIFCAKQGFVEAIGERPTSVPPSIIYKVRDRRMPAPVQRRANFASSQGRRCQQMWTAIRALKLFTIRELAVAATTSEIVVGEKRAREYVQLLLRAGYVAEIGQRTRRGQQARWKLMPACNTGPLAPATLERGAVLYDRNLGRAVNVTAPETAGRAA